MKVTAFANDLLNSIIKAYFAVFLNEPKECAIGEVLIFGAKIVDQTELGIYPQVEIVIRPRRRSSSTAAIRVVRRRMAG